MSEEVNHDRRCFPGIAVMTLAVANLGLIPTAKAQSSPEQSEELLAIKSGQNTSFGPLKQINAGVLNVRYAEVGPAGCLPVVLLHGWPYDIHVTGYSAQGRHSW